MSTEKKYNKGKRKGRMHSKEGKRDNRTIISMMKVN